MKCPKCETKLKSTDKFCSNCGEKVAKEKKTKAKVSKEEVKEDNVEIFKKIGDNIEKILETEDTSEEYKKEDIENYKGLALLSYIGPLALIPYLKGKKYKYAYYHAVQGMNLLAVWVCYSVLALLFFQIKETKSCDTFFGSVGNCVSRTPIWIRFPFAIMGFALFALSIIGIVYALLGKAKKLPLIEKVKIFK